MRLTKNQKRLIANSGLWAAYEGLTVAFLSAFALALGASNTIIGTISAVPFIAAILAQIPGAKLLEYFKRKKVYVFFSGISRLLWLAIIAAPYLFARHPLIIIVIAYFIIRLTEYIGDPAWTTTAADITPIKKRGILFGTRNIFLVIGMMATSTAGAIYLDLFPKNSPHGFTTMFFVGILVGIYATTQFARIQIPLYRDKKHHKIKEFFSKKTLKPYTSIIFFFNFSYALASPLFVVYILKNLGLSYKIYIGTIIITSLLKILANPHWGRISDKYGDKPVAVICIFGTALVPFIYLFVNSSTLWLIVPAQIISGIAWAGVSLSTFNLLLDFTKPKTRATEIAQHTMLVAIPMIFAPIFGGILADNIKHFALSGIPFVFLASTILRVMSAWLMFQIREPRAKKEYNLFYVFERAISVHPERFAGRMINIFLHKLLRGPRY